VDVRVEAAAADHITARRRNAGAPEPRKQGAREEERRADPLREHRVDVVGRKPLSVDPDLVRAGPLRVRACRGDELEHRLDVADARDVRERDRLVREQARGEDRQSPVLVPGGPDPAVERVPSLDDEGLRHRRDGHAAPA
jgi:hypothetical protein